MSFKEGNDVPGKHLPSLHQKERPGWFSGPHGAELACQGSTESFFRSHREEALHLTLPSPWQSAECWEVGGLTWVARMPCLIPVLCVPDPMTPAAVTSDTAPRLGKAGQSERDTKDQLGFAGTMGPLSCRVKSLRAE